MLKYCLLMLLWMGSCRGSALSFEDSSRKAVKHFKENGADWLKFADGSKLQLATWARRILEGQKGQRRIALGPAGIDTVFNKEGQPILSNNFQIRGYSWNAGHIIRVVPAVDLYDYANKGAFGNKLPEPEVSGEDMKFKLKQPEPQYIYPSENSELKEYTCKVPLEAYKSLINRLYVGPEVDYLENVSMDQNIADTCLRFMRASYRFLGFQQSRQVDNIDYYVIHLVQLYIEDKQGQKVTLDAAEKSEEATITLSQDNQKYTITLMRETYWKVVDSMCTNPKKFTSHIVPITRIIKGEEELPLKQFELQIMRITKAGQPNTFQLVLIPVATQSKSA